MKLVALGLAAALSIVPAAAQDKPAAPAAAPAAGAKFSLDTPIEALVADPAAKAVVDANIPGITAHPSYEMFKSMSFNQLAPMAPDQLKPELLAKLSTGLAALK